MHNWGDDFDWKGLDEAITFIETNLVRWGRINVTQAKEKFGTARIYCSLGWYQFHNITHPKTVYNRYPKWLWELDCYYGTKIVPFLFGWVVHYHAWLYRKVYSMAVKKYPHLREEILCCADYDELLEGL
jgi:hypothetical protein